MARPSGRVQDRPFQMRVTEEFLRTIDEWRRKQPDLPSRAEAIRRLVGEALKRAKSKRG
jgi:Arc/MetJ-type ribon-helix-helix transcriptional regulator